MDFNLRDKINYSSGGILSNVVLKNEKMDVTLFCMAEGTEISEHTSTKKGFVYVIEGKGIFNLAKENIQMLPGVFIQLDENMVHWLKAEQNTSFLLALVK
jgi:quercetin dioxygenase-like cupin family protein